MCCLFLRSLFHSWWLLFHQAADSGLFWPGSDERTSQLFRLLMIRPRLHFFFEILNFSFVLSVPCNTRSTASMAMVLIQVVLGGAQFGRSKLPSRHPPGSTWTYGYSFYMACSVFSIFATAFIVFLAFSKKKKGDNIINEELALADEHVAMGR